MQPYISVKCVNKTFNKKIILEGIDFQIKQGSIVGLIGANGAGKTTMLRLLNGVITYDEGEIFVANLNPYRDGERVRQMSGMVTESANLYPDMTGLENLRFFAELYGKTNEKRIAWLLETFQLSEHQHRPAGTYSTGMKKRLALAKALLHEPDILYLDEPTNGLDPEGIDMIITFLKEWNKSKGTTIFICSHLLEQLETLCDDYIFIDRGRIIEKGTKEELIQKYRHHIELIVESNVEIKDERYMGFPAKKLSPGLVSFILPTEDSITPLLQTIMEKNWVHGVKIKNNNLESLYFAIKEAHHE